MGLSERWWFEELIPASRTTFFANPATTRRCVAPILDAADP